MNQMEHEQKALCNNLKKNSINKEKLYRTSLKFKISNLYD
jgi:hypothetical protein